MLAHGRRTQSRTSRSQAGARIQPLERSRLWGGKATAAANEPRSNVENLAVHKRRHWLWRPALSLALAETPVAVANKEKHLAAGADTFPLPGNASLLLRPTLARPARGAGLGAPTARTIKRALQLLVRGPQQADPRVSRRCVSARAPRACAVPTCSIQCALQSADARK